MLQEFTFIPIKFNLLNCSSSVLPVEIFLNPYSVIHTLANPLSCVSLITHAFRGSTMASEVSEDPQSFTAAPFPALTPLVGCIRITPGIL